MRRIRRIGLDEDVSVIVTGSLGYDYIMDFPGRFADRIMADKIHKLSLSFLVDKLSKNFGGTAGNIAYNLHFLGVTPQIVACAGNDFDQYLDHLHRHHIPTDTISVHKDVPTSSYFVITDQDDNQIGSFYVGAMKHAKDLSIAQVTDSGNHGDSRNRTDKQPFVVIAPTDPMAMKKYVKECRDLKVPYLYDPAFQIATFSSDELKEAIEGAAMLIGNDYEISLIEQRLAVPHEELIASVPIVITTLGAKGSTIETRNDAIHVKSAKPKNTSDPTGAGDAYRAGFLVGYLRYARFPESKKFGFRESVITIDELLVCGQMGSVAAVYTVEKYGTQTHAFTMKEFCKRYEDNYSHPLSL